MATTYQVPPLIGVTAPDEDMDLLSDNGRMEQDHDQDLIDIDAPDNHNADEDFDFTIDDVASDRGAMPTHEDDEMLDEYDEGDTFTHEEAMQDERQPDDELLDDASEHDEDTHVEDSTYDLTAHGQQPEDTFVTAFEGQTNDDNFTETLQTDARLQPDTEYVTDKIDYVEEEDTAAVQPEPTNNVVQAPIGEVENLQSLPVDVTEIEHVSEEQSESATADPVSTVNEQTPGVSEQQEETILQVDDAQNLEATEEQDHLVEQGSARFAPAEPVELSAVEVEVVAPSLTVETTENQQVENAKATEAAADVPTILVDYYGDEYSLFPPAQSLPGLSEFADYSYLLEDVACFHKSIHNLLEECKHMLSTDIDEDQELELEVPALGLVLAQSSQDSMVHTMNQIATVFHTLNANDGLEDMQPLWVVLKSKTRFASRLAALQQAVNEQKGMSEVSHLLGLEEMDGSDQLDALGIQHVIEQADYESSEDAEPEHEAAADEPVEGVDVGTVGESDPAATEIEPQEESTHREKPVQDETSLAEEQIDEVAPIEDLAEDVHSSATSTTLKEDVIDQSELDEQDEIPRTVVEGAVPVESELRTGYGLDEDFDEDEDEELEADEAVDADGLTHEEAATDAAPSEPLTVKESWDLDGSDGVSQLPEIEDPTVTDGSELNNLNGLAPTDEVANQNVGQNIDDNGYGHDDENDVGAEHENDHENDEDLLTFEEEDNITFENEEIAPTPADESQATLTEATLTDDNTIDFTEEAEASQTGTKRTWEQHLDDDLLVDDGLESPKRARHSDVA